ncbi:MAG: M15 family metallopeptidase [Spirochaetota bacterium]
MRRLFALLALAALLVPLPLSVPFARPAAARAETAQPAPPGFNLLTRPSSATPAGDGVSFEGRAVLLAMQRAYPLRVEDVSWRDGDWAIRVDEQWFFWTGGRLLPARERDEIERYDPIPFYRYEPGPLAVPEYSAEERAALGARADEIDRDPPRRHPGFMNAIWRITDRSTSWQRQKTTFFLGMKTMVHRDLLEDLAAVEEAIMAAARNDAALRAFIAGLRTVEGYNFRRVDGTASLSNHSYGVAVDLLPASYGGRQVYWRWARDGGVDWLGLSLRERYSIPQPIVDAFERYGFVWGGKWSFFDTIHFEYRPEILILNGHEVELR